MYNFDVNLDKKIIPTKMFSNKHKFIIDSLEKILLRHNIKLVLETFLMKKQNTVSELKNIIHWHFNHVKW